MGVVIPERLIALVESPYWCLQPTAGIVERIVEASECVEGGVDHSRYVLRRCDIGPNEDGLPTTLNDFCNNRVSLFLAACRHHE